MTERKTELRFVRKVEEPDYTALNALTAKAASGDDRAMNALIKQYMQLIRGCAVKWMAERNVSVFEIEDAVTAAMEGFWHSTRKFTLDRGRDFRSFVVYGMNDSLRNLYSSEWSHRGVSAEQRKLWGRVKEAENAILASDGVPTDHAIAAWLGDTTPEKIADARAAWFCSTPESIELLSEKAGDSWQREYWTDSYTGLDPMQRFADALCLLSEEERRFVEMLQRDCSRSEIAEAFHMSERSVSNWKERIRKSLEVSMGIAA